jgi:hypothetical protein
MGNSIINGHMGEIEPKGKRKEGLPQAMSCGKNP